jgi:hypothetical protein
MMQGGYMQIGLADIGNFFVRSILKVPVDGPGATTDIVILMARACTYTVLKTPEEEIDTVLSKYPFEDANTIRVNYDRVMQRRLALTQQEYHRQINIQQQQVPNIGDETTTAANQNPHPVTPAAARRIIEETPLTIAAAADSPINATGRLLPAAAARHQRVDLEERKNLKNMRTTIEKIEALVRIEEERATGSLTSGAKTFASKFLKPAINCDVTATLQLGQ